MAEFMRASYEILSPINGQEILRSIEQIGRVCYKSEDKITEDSALRFVESIIKRGHLSVIEHVCISVRFICDRGVSHELVRHRIASFSQESSRYCDYNKKITFIIPCWSSIIAMEDVQLRSGSLVVDRSKPCETQLDILGKLPQADNLWINEMVNAECTYRWLRNCGWKPEQARSVLPNSLKTELVMTANLREWRHILSLRVAPPAHPQMRELMVPLLAEFKQRIPVIFDDINPT